MGHEMRAPDTKLTYEDYCLIPDDGRRHEILDGDHFVTPSPDVYHQSISIRLAVQLFGLIEEAGLGRCLAAPIDMQLGEHDIVVPDLVVILDSNRSILTPTKVKGSPDLVVEILSPSNPRHDTVLKKKLYERAGIREYWIVDPDEHVVEVYVLGEGGYTCEEHASKRVALRALSDVIVDLDRVW